MSNERVVYAPVGPIWWSANVLFGEPRGLKYDNNFLRISLWSALFVFEVAAADNGKKTMEKWRLLIFAIGFLVRSQFRFNFELGQF